jgi:cyclic pyranopterin phosphate synthase
MSDFSHLEESGDAQMVDVGQKDVTERRAVARGFVYMEESTARAIAGGEVSKGEVGQVGRIAGIMGAKKTPDLIPMCHPIGLEDVAVRIYPRPEDGAVEIVAETAATAKTGVEMEALTAVSTAALTVYDMCKSADRSMHVGDIHVVDKQGGASGRFAHPDPPGLPSVDDPSDEE